MSDTSDFLPDELSWAAGGHASDVALTAIADGQRAIVPPAVLAHVEACTACTTHLGHAALLSIHAGAELAAARQHAHLTERRPLPRLAIALGLAVAAIGLSPSLLDGRDASALRMFVTRDVPIFVRAFETVARRLDEPGSAAGLAVTYATATMLVLMGFAIVRILPKNQKETSK
jgi:hypothetical protein